MTDLGFNWHINQYLKFYVRLGTLDVQPTRVLYSPGHRQLTSDLFLARIQLYF